MKRTDKYSYKTSQNITYIYFEQKNGTKHVSIVDTSKLKKIFNHEYKWHVSLYRDGNFYVVANVYEGIVNGKPKYSTILLHRYLLNNPKSKYVDHENNKTLDNRISNLRVGRQEQNVKNRKGYNKNNTSGYRNVTWIRGYWRVQLQIEGKNHMFPERFENVKEAGEFAKLMREKHYKEYAGKE